MQLDQYKLTTKLGEGFSAEVRKAIAPDGKSYAVKIFDLSKHDQESKSYKLIKEEVESTKDMNHQNIVKYH